MESALHKAFPQLPFYTAYTSPTIRRILAGRGQTISDLGSALEEMAGQGVQHAIVQPTHMLEILSQEYPQQEEEALILFGHGTEHLTNAVYPALQTVFHMNARKDVLVGTVEDWPGIEEILQELKELAVPKVHLVPMMVVAGDHACNDMAGQEPDSWKSRLEAAGYQVRCTLSGLGMLGGIQQMAVDHLRESLGTASND